MSAAGHAPVHRSADAARARRGAALLSRGFRPFFLGAGVWALVGMALWPAVFSGSGHDSDRLLGCRLACA